MGSQTLVLPRAQWGAKVDSDDKFDQNIKVQQASTMQDWHSDKHKRLEQVIFNLVWLLEDNGEHKSLCWITCVAFEQIKGVI